MSATKIVKTVYRFTWNRSDQRRKEGTGLARRAQRNGTTLIADQKGDSGQPSAS